MSLTSRFYTFYYIHELFISASEIQVIFIQNLADKTILYIPPVFNTNQLTTNQQVNPTQIKKRH